LDVVVIKNIQVKGQHRPLIGDISNLSHTRLHATLRGFKTSVFMDYLSHLFTSLRVCNNFMGL